MKLKVTTIDVDHVDDISNLCSHDLPIPIQKTGILMLLFGAEPYIANFAKNKDYYNPLYRQTERYRKARQVIHHVYDVEIIDRELVIRAKKTIEES